MSSRIKLFANNVLFNLSCFVAALVMVTSFPPTAAAATGLVEATAQCLGVPEGVARPPVTVCEGPRHYEFNVVGDRYKYDKQEYQSALTQLIGEWAALHLAHGSMQGATFSFFVAVPEAVPRSSSARVVVRPLSAAPFVVFVGLHPKDWQPLTNNDVAILYKGDYPESYGFGAGDIMAKAHPGTPAEKVAEAAYNAGGLPPVSLGHDQWFLEFTPFEELAAIDALEETGVFATVDLNNVYEWIAHRREVFHFFAD